MSARPRVAIVNTFFGTPPPWLPAFFRSCQTNADVEWLIYADFDVPAYKLASGDLWRARFISAGVIELDEPAVRLEVEAIYAGTELAA